MSTQAGLKSVFGAKKKPAVNESRWSKAKEQAAKQGHEGEFGYITGLYKKMMGEDAKTLEFKSFLKITEMDDVADMGYGDNEDDDDMDGLDLPSDEDDGECDPDMEDCDLDGFEPDETDDFDMEDGHQLTDIIDLDDESGEDEFDDDDESELDNEDEFDLDGEEEFNGRDVESRRGKLGEGAGNTLHMKAKNRVYRANDAIKKNNASVDKSKVPSLSKSDIKSYSKDLVGMVNKTGKPISSKAAQKGNVRESDDTPFSFLRSLLLTEKKKKGSLKKAAKSVYRRDYLKTKNKPYRAYHPDDHNKSGE